MKLREIVNALNLQIRNGQDKLENEVRGGYVSDLLSDVIAHANEDDIWITLQTHQNIIAVSVMKNLAGIIIINDREPDSATMEKAKEEGVPIFISKDTAFEVVAKLCQLGVSGAR